MEIKVMDDVAFKKLNRIALVLAIALPLIVALLFGVKVEIDYPFSVYLLPKINAGLNAFSALCLISALYFIKKGNIKLHTSAIYAAMGASIGFLLLYVLYHISTAHTTFQGEGVIRYVYFILLITHILLAIIQPAFVLYAFLYAFTGRIEKHKRIVKIAYPIWLYVAITGVICYLMISPYYQ